MSSLGALGSVVFLSAVPPDPWSEGFGVPVGTMVTLGRAAGWAMRVRFARPVGVAAAFWWEETWGCGFVDVVASPSASLSTPSAAPAPAVGALCG
ncbi:MAG: hypothetical protein AAFU72_08125, partial [Pseudomonadota bacterium]